MRAQLPRVLTFPELPPSDYEPTVVSLEVQAQILAEIPDERREIFLAQALLGLRPGEDRALNVSCLKPSDIGPMLHVRHAMQGNSANARRDAPCPLQPSSLHGLMSTANDRT